KGFAMTATNGQDIQDTQERAKFLPRQIVLPADLGQDQNYFLTRLRRDNRVFHGYGIKDGLLVKLISTAEADRLVKETSLSDAEDLSTNWLRITAGYALTPKGDVIFLPKDV